MLNLNIIDLDLLVWGIIESHNQEEGQGGGCGGECSQGICPASVSLWTVPKGALMDPNRMCRKSTAKPCCPTLQLNWVLFKFVWGSGRGVQVEMARKKTTRKIISFLPPCRHVYEVRNGFRAAAENSFTSLYFHLFPFNILYILQAHVFVESFKF